MCIRDRLSYYAAAKEVGGGLSQQELRAGLKKESKVPVSYTHLDVYKRQA